jgi:RNA polymerase sigma-70 factor (ECF subfamily)
VPPVDRFEVARVVTRVHHEEWARVVAALTRRFGDLDVAEEAAAEAFATAVDRWLTTGIPANPGGWLMTTAGRKALDRLRRERRRDEKYRLVGAALEEASEVRTGPIDDERLRLLFICCHPALPPEGRVALTLRMVGGLTVSEIAHAFLVQEATMGQRISRAKARIRAAGTPYRVPDEEDLPERLSGVLAVLYLIFNEGYLATGPGGAPVREDLVAEAIRLARLLVDLMPEEGEVAGLLALMLLAQARRATRLSAEGELVTLADQNRAAWDHAMIDEACRLIEGPTHGGRDPGRYRTLAAISATHATAADAQETDWRRIVSLYDRLEQLDPSPIVALNRAVAVAEVDGPAAAMRILDGLEVALSRYHALFAVRADLARRLGLLEEARSAYGQAIALAQNAAERAYLARRQEELGGAGVPRPG